LAKSVGKKGTTEAQRGRAANDGSCKVGVPSAERIVTKPSF
jgi:hypothetical protein